MMYVHTPFRHKIRAVVLTVFSCLLFIAPPSQAGCGCDKPPPEPAPVIPHAAFSGMKISLFHAALVEGQSWTVRFHNNAGASASRKATVVLRRDIGDITRQTITPRLILSLPGNLPVGPTHIAVSRETTSFTIPDAAFTVIGKPVMVAEKTLKFTKTNYKTAVGADGVLYFSIGGLAKVCQPMKFKALMEGNPLRFTDQGRIDIFNMQGFVIESLSCDAAGCTPPTHYFPDMNNGNNDKSDKIEYWRHSFTQYCTDHRSGGAKDLDPQDRNWHRDGTPHVDYSALIFAVSGHYDDGSLPDSGAQVFDLNLESDPDDRQGGWETEKDEEDHSGPH